MNKYMLSVTVSTVHYELLNTYIIGTLRVWPMHDILIDLFGHSNYMHVYTLDIYDIEGKLNVHNSLSLHPTSFIKKKIHYSFYGP